MKGETVPIAIVLARRLTTILPAMPRAEALETTCLHRVAGLTGAHTALVTTQLCRDPDQTISDAGRTGGGHVPTPGEGSLAHHGVCCLDARPACRRLVLAVWRQLLHEDVVTVAALLLRGMLIPTRFFRRLYFLVVKSDP
jgi:magnesium chelatase family protein